MLLQRATLPLFGLLFALFISEAQGNEAVKNSLTLIQEWKALDFNYETPQDRERAIQRGEFNQSNTLPFGFDVYYKKKNGQRNIFVVVPRLQRGVPITLGWVRSKKSPEGNSLIEPYPNWDMQKIGNCDAITNARKTQIDRCGRLWVVDSGQLMKKRICPPQLLIISAEDGSVLSRYKFPREDYRENSIFLTIVVDTRGDKCEDTFAYVADLRGFAIIVYDHAKRQSWRVEDKTFYPEPKYGTISIKGDKFERMDGILGMALSSLSPEGDRTLYYHAMASRSESSVQTSVLRNASLFCKNPGAVPEAFRTFEHERSSQSATEAMDKNDVLFFGLLGDLAIGCWNSRRYNYGKNSIEKIVYDPETMQFPIGVKVIPGPNGVEELWVLTNRYQKYVAGTLDLKETNFRIQAGRIDELISGTKCQPVILKPDYIYTQ